MSAAIPKFTQVVLIRRAEDFGELEYFDGMSPSASFPMTNWVVVR
ncbi:MAG: hypothetical protein R3D03_01305 [Geminicoccaceae bacterium]